MGTYCSNKILAFGPEDQLVQTRQLIEGCSRSEEGAIRTYFSEVFEPETDNSVGIRWHSEEEGCIWLGACDPPMEFLHELSASFPDLTFELRIDADDVDYVEIYELRRGISVRRILNPETNSSSPSKSNFEAIVEKRRRLLSCVAEHLNDGVIYAAQRAMSDLLNDNPKLAEELLLPVFERSEFWPETMAKVALGIDTNEDFDIDELMEKFRMLDS